MSLYASSKFNDLDYFDPGLATFDETLAGGLQVEGVQSLLRRLNRDRTRKTLVLGYPVRTRQVRGRSGWTGNMVEPVMLFLLQGGPRDLSSATFEGLPIVNPAFLRHFAQGGLADLFREAMQLAEELGLTDTGGGFPELDELFNRLHAVRPEWDWREDPDVDELSVKPKIADLREQGIYNRAVICSIERSPFTQGLETELESLSKLSKGTYERTALGRWISSEASDGVAPEAPVLLEPIPLNVEQRAAIQSALTKPLTVITGPPGTGKSQVVTALLMNAAYNGKRVLFASKNNKAVDVVVERVNAFGSRPILLRLGDDEHRAALVTHLGAMLGSKATHEDRESYQSRAESHLALAAELSRQDRRLEQTVALRNRTDALEQRIEAIRKEVGQSEVRTLAAIANVDITAIGFAVTRVKKALIRADKYSQPFWLQLLWPLVRKAREIELSDAKRRIHSLLNGNANSRLFNPPLGEDASLWQAFSERAQKLCVAYKDVKEYFESLFDLQGGDSLEEIARHHLELAEQVANNSVALWREWMLLQSDRLGPEDRQAIGEYSSVVQLILGANQDNRRVEGNVLRRHYELFGEVADALPCWAVTSLRARNRIPLDAGIFDLLIVDEASQCDIASALPLLYRSKCAVIIGDPQQLRHISALRPDKDQQLLVKHGLEANRLSWSYSAHSLFDLASSICESDDIVALRDHHRSHADIIGFSNEHFYEGKLRVATNYTRLHKAARNETAIRWLNLSGRAVRPTAGGALNDEEAQAVVGELKRLLNQGYRGSIGVVSPFRAQANRIRDMLERDGDTAQRLVANDCLVDTVHRFQGDERDLMIFSPVVAQGISANALRFLGANGNLFNVAITRARSTLLVVGDKSASSSSGVDYLQRFVKYVNDLGNDEPWTDDLQQREFGAEYPTVSRPDRVSDWERYLYKVMYGAGHRPIPQYTVDQYDLDFALFGTGDRKLDIEVDGERYHRAWDGELCRRDQIRNQRLMEIGWDVMRFWVYEIRDDLEGCIERVNAWVAAHSAD
ncbi:MAG: AAA domain-containing protein [Chloroflexota bacterium]|nr:AAA domain-containing protein [Chloroflexota bacterium]